MVLAMVMGVGLMSCSSDDDNDDSGDLNEYEKALVGKWRSIDDETNTEVMTLQLNSNRTGRWECYYKGKLENSSNLKNWMATDKRLFTTYENGESESGEYSMNGDKVLIGEILYQKQ